jgi:hypothetical protein
MNQRLHPFQQPGPLAFRLLTTELAVSISRIHAPPYVRMNDFDFLDLAEPDIEDVARRIYAASR